MKAIKMPDGSDMPLVQIIALADLARAFPGSIWHFNDCGCCVCLHPGGDKSQGWIVNPSGDAELHEAGHA